jgi:hypothetical protein
VCGCVVVPRLAPHKRACDPCRWMVSGTPFCTSINDLHGELAFLEVRAEDPHTATTATHTDVYTHTHTRTHARTQVWPFSLNNDGFWERKIQGPWGKKRPEALALIRKLVSVCMIRHSKAQARGHA